jgi:hypothetical protein
VVPPCHLLSVCMNLWACTSLAPWIFRGLYSCSVFKTLYVIGQCPSIEIRGVQKGLKAEWQFWLSLENAWGSSTFLRVIIRQTTVSSLGAKYIFFKTSSTGQTFTSRSVFSNQKYSTKQQSILS